MGEVEDKLEVDRVSNLITGFGWRIVKQETLADELELTIRKNRTPSTESESAPPT